MELQTDRLILRRWRPEDREPFAALNSDPEVMEHFPSPLTRAESDTLVDWIEAGFERNGFGIWALERVDTGQFIGFTGLNRPTLEAHFMPAVEVGWRLAPAHWGNGFATEAAAAAISDGFTRVGLDEIVAFTATTNLRSVAVMKRLGMTRDPSDDFDHPSIEPGHRLQRHLLYRLRRADWKPSDLD